MAIRQFYPEISPSLNLDFANTKALDPRVTFTRASTATFYDGRTVAKAEENLLRRSEQFDDDVWVKTATTISSNTAVAPNGTTTAEVLTATSANATTVQSIPIIAGDYTFSIWIRRVSGTGNVDITTNSGGTWVTQSITSSWARYTVTQTLTAGSRTPGIRIATSGDVVEVWGAQLEQRSSVTAYTPTTTQPITNHIPVLQTAAANVARFDHNPITGESLGLLIEEPRTNLLLWSEEFENAAWVKSQSSIVANTVVAPNGTPTGDRLVENTASAGHAVRNTFAFAASTTYTASLYLKAGERTSGTFLVFDNESAIGSWHLNLLTGELTQGTAVLATTATAVNVGNGWWRMSITFTSTASPSGSYFDFRMSPEWPIANPIGASYTGDGTSGIFIWGAQLEVGAFPTSYIPTGASQVTRSADAASMTGTNFSSWYRQDGGTIFGDAIFGADLTAGRLIAGISGLSSADRITIGLTTNYNGGVVANNIVQTSINTGIKIAQSRVAFAFRSNAFALSANGSPAATSASGNQLPVVDRLFIGSRVDLNPFVFANGHIRRIAYYPQRLPNTTLQALTA